MAEGPREAGGTAASRSTSAPSGEMISDLEAWVYREFGMDISATLSSCVFCKSALHDPQRTRAGRSDINDIKVLPCLHSACGLCLQESLVDCEELVCPLCDSQLTELAYHKYPSNFVVHQGIDYRAIQETSVTCEECVEALEAVKYCQQCCSRLCEECVEHHRRSKATASHNLLELKEQHEHAIHRAALCNLHGNAKIEFFCETCSVVCCRECILTEHENHNYKLPVGDLVECHQRLIKEHILQLRKLAESLQDKHRESTKKIEQFDHELEACKVNLEKFASQVKLAIDDRRALMLQEVDAYCKWRRMTFEENQTLLTAVISDTWQTVDFADKVLARGTSMEVLFLKSYFSSHFPGALGDKLAKTRGMGFVAEPSLGIAWDSPLMETLQALREMGDVSAAGAPSRSPSTQSGLSSLVDAHRSGVPRSVLLSAEVQEEEASPEPAPAAAARSRDLVLSKHWLSEALGEALGEVDPCLAVDPRRERCSEARGAGNSGDDSSATARKGPAQKISLQQAIFSDASPGTSISSGSASPPRKPTLIQLISPAKVSHEGVHGRDNEDMKIRGLGPRKAVLGLEGEGLGSFRSPCGISVDSQHLYIADTLNHRIQVFHRIRAAGGEPSLLGQIEVPESGEVTELQDPSGLCCMGDGRLAVVQYGLDRLLAVELGKDSTQPASVRVLAAEAQLYGPFGVGYTLGRVVVADSCNHRCLVLSTSGATLFEFGSRGCGPGQFEYPECLATFSDGYIAVSDKDNHRIQVFNDRGAFCNYIPSVWKPGGSSSSSSSVVPPGRLCGPMGMCSDQRDRLFVCDCGSNRIQIFTRHGEWLWSSDSAPGSSGLSWTFRSPTGVAIDESGNVYVASDHCVQIF